ncbi:MAG: S46 family peptidase, partial [Tangfeifania sp.]
KFFPISMKGIQPGDFTMVFGNPGSTMQYIPSNEVDIIMNQRDPDRIAIREKKLAVIGEDMQTDPKVRIQYAAKYASISNAWKKWQGEILGLERLDAVNKKLEFEKEFEAWAKSNETWEDKYRPVFANFDKLYASYSPFIRAFDYYSEIVRSRGVETFQLAGRVNSIINNIENDQSDRIERDVERLKEFLPSFFKDFNQPTDEKLFEVLLPLLGENLETEFLPDYYTELMEKHGDKLVDKIYRKSVLHDEKALTEILEPGNEKQLLKLRKDPMVELYNRLIFQFETVIDPVVDSINARINENMQTYMAGILEMKDRGEVYPDANLTLRVTYGKVEGYEPRDGVNYDYYTTLEGIMEKDNPEIYDYNVPERLRQLYETKDYGQYSENGYLPVCFIASNHTTGGNSGSPVVNGNGELIGVNFDRCWEGTMSDIMYDPERCRNIAIDIRYALFLIDKFAGAGYLLDEMELVE